MKAIKVISVLAVCMLAVAVFAPQAKADAASGLIIYSCGPCGGSVVSDGLGGFNGAISIPMTFATNPGDEVGEFSTLLFSTTTGAISVNDGADFALLGGTLFDLKVGAPNALGEQQISFDVAFPGTFAADGSASFFVTALIAPIGTVEAAQLSVVTPEPASLLLLGTGLLGLGGAVRRRFLQS